MGCSMVAEKEVVVNKNAPIGSTQKIVVVKVNPVAYTGETVVIGFDKNNKETHYDVHHTDAGMVDNTLTTTLGFLFAKLL